MKSEKEIKESAAKHFEANPNVEAFHVTVDGQCFESMHDANEHSKSLRFDDNFKGVEESELRKIVEIKKGGVVVTVKTVSEVTELINAATTIEEVNAIVGDDARKGVKVAAEKKIKELSA